MRRRYNGRQKGAKGRRQNIEALEAKEFKCAIETLNGDGDGLKSHGKALKIDGEALKDDGVFNGNQGEEEVLTGNGEAII